jgi:hypothetical protein
MYPDTVKTRGKIVFMDMQKGIFGYDEKGEPGHPVKALAHSRCTPDSCGAGIPFVSSIKCINAFLSHCKKHTLARSGNQTE